MVTIRSTANLRTPAIILVTLLSLWYLLSSSGPSGSYTTFQSYFRRPTYQHRRDPPVLGCPAEHYSADSWLARQVVREKAAVLLLARNEDLDQLLPTLDNFEKTFNAKFRYPYVFLNDAPYSSAFQAGILSALPAGAEVKFGQIPEEQWRIPDWLDKAAMRARFKKMEEEGIQYAGREGYHHMCRFYSGPFALHPLLKDYNYYWRLEPGVRFHSEIQYDPFVFMAQKGKVYGWVITIVESANTIPTLFQSVLDWRREVVGNNSASLKFGNKLKMADWQQKDELWDFFIDDTERDRRGKYKHPEKYNLCHFWTNFEIGDLRFFRSKEYRSLFDYLDRRGGFYSERWGDAPLRSLALGLLAGFDKVHYFEDFVYKHDWFMHVPADPHVGCHSDPPPWAEWTRDIDNDASYSCLPRWRQLDSAA